MKILNIQNLEVKMDCINTFYNELNKNSQLFGFILALGSAIFLSCKYLSQKKLELKDKRFEIYHKLIKDFVGKDQTDIKLDYQISICYELRNFKEYYPVSNRILEAFKHEILKNDLNNRLVKEINMTIKFINSNWFKRNFCQKEYK